ncbi:MAG: tyrosine-type recombinase/integrase, partial [Candidatus Dormibacteria bacterium]
MPAATSKPRQSRARIRQRRAAAAGRPGLWEGRVSFVDSASTGGRRWLSVYGQTRAEVEAKLAGVMAARGKGITPPRGGLTVANYLANWIDQAGPDLKPSTAARYRQLIELHIVPRIGAQRLTALTPAQVNAMTSSVIASGQSAYSANHARAVLRTALNDAIRQGILVRNAAALADPRRVTERVVDPIRPEDAWAIIDAFDGHPLHALVAAAMWTGLRQGELLGLTWDHVDLDRGELRVTSSLSRVRRVTRVSTTKTKGSARAVPLPQSPRDLLASHKLRQREVRLAAADWDDSWGDLVFCTAAGAPLNATTVSGAFSDRLVAAGLKRRRFQDLRHGAATLWLAAGVDLKTVSALLGHSTIATTA